MKRPTDNNTRLFQETILIHLDAAYNYARWLVRNAQDAEDLTQEACVRAFAGFHTFEQTNPKSWLLTIVRNTFLNQVQKEKRQAEIIYLDAKTQSSTLPTPLHDTATPEQHLLREDNSRLVHEAINELDTEFREIIVLRELEGLSYKEIATITDCAMGTVMSRLSRARGQLKSKLNLSLNIKEGEV
jgi:RNA polymerase sigma-70 factor (ECF subfamily)